MIRPTLALAVAINRAAREADEWFSEPDDLERVERALGSIDGIDDPVRAASVLAFRVARAQGFAEGNKRTGLLLARWLLDRNGLDRPPCSRPTTATLRNSSSSLSAVHR